MAAKAGRAAEARRLLETVLDADERNEQAWLWLSGVVDDDEERIICLENVLTINPHNEVARQGLANLGVAPAVSTAASLAGHSAAVENLGTGVPGPLASASTPGVELSGGDSSPGRSSAADNRVFIAITIVLALMLTCIVAIVLGFVILSPPG